MYTADELGHHSALQWHHNERDGVSNHRQPRDCLFDRLFRRKSKETSKPRVTGLYEWNSPVTGEFPAQRASNAETVSIWWRHHVLADVLAPGPCFNMNTIFSCMNISVIKRRRSWDRLIFIIRIPILIRRHLKSETPPGGARPSTGTFLLTEKLSSTFLFYVSGHNSKWLSRSCVISVICDILSVGSNMPFPPTMKPRSSDDSATCIAPKFHGGFHNIATEPSFKFQSDTIILQWMVRNFLRSL